MRTVVVKAAELARVPWKNGLGTTRELARGGEGEDGWAWRLSIADVERDSEFSRFAGCDRTLALLAGEGLMLHVGGEAPVALRRPLACARFAGEEATRGTLLGGPTVDFNVITRRDQVEHEVVPLADGHVVSPASYVALFVLSGSLSLPMAVGPGEIALCDEVHEPFTLSGDAAGLLVRLQERAKAR